MGRPGQPTPWCGHLLRRALPLRCPFTSSVAYDPARRPRSGRSENGDLDQAARQPGYVATDPPLGSGHYQGVRAHDRLGGVQGDSYDNATLEALNSLFKAKLVRDLRLWNGSDQYDHRRPHGEISRIPPAETTHYSSLPTLTMLKQVLPSLKQTQGLASC